MKYKINNIKYERYIKRNIWIENHIKRKFKDNIKMHKSKWWNNIKKLERKKNSFKKLNWILHKIKINIKIG